MTREEEIKDFQDFQDFAKREILAFAKAHENDDVTRLLLSAARYPSIDMPAAVQQIEGLRTAREKWPSLLRYEDYLYPPRLNREQASSEAAAAYKASIFSTFNFPISTIADLTGGMGIDTLAFAKVAGHVDYVERDPMLCALMKHNCTALGADNIDIHCSDSLEWLADSYDVLFVDPARRDIHGRKVAAFEDCTPDILKNMPLLRKHCRVLMVKASPMIDIDLACHQLDGVAEVHVVAGGGECKEVLFLCGDGDGEPIIHCGRHSFTRAGEATAEVCYCESVGRYLYEPDAAMMKAGPYRSICQWYEVEMLGHNTHMYTSNRLVEDFPGRRFEVLRELKLSKKSAAEAITRGRAHVVVRNYPVAAADLQRQLGLKEGGELYVVATTVGHRPCGFLCARM